MRATLFWLTAACLVSACGFTAPAPAPGSDVDDPTDPYPGGSPIDDPPTGTPTAERHCSPDPALHLCLDFDDQATIGNDGSAFDHNATCSAITRMPRTVDGIVEQAGLLDPASRMVVPENPDLDVSGELTLSLWARPMGHPAIGSAYWMLDNNRQYYAQYLSNGKFRCGIGTTTVDAALPVQDDHWYHVGCVLDEASQTFRIYVNGNIANCRHTNAKLATDGLEGISIGSNIDAGPTFSQPFVGGLDNIEVFSRALDHDEICDAASNQDCAYTPICL